MYCSNCGSIVNDYSRTKYCSKCGRELNRKYHEYDIRSPREERNTQEPSYVVKATAPNVEKIKNYVAAAVIIVLLLGTVKLALSTFICDDCGKTSTKKYRTIDADTYICEECAYDYWFPLDPERARVK